MIESKKCIWFQVVTAKYKLFFRQIVILMMCEHNNCCDHGKQEKKTLAQSYYKNCWYQNQFDMKSDRCFKIKWVLVRFQIETFLELWTLKLVLLLLLLFFLPLPCSILPLGLFSTMITDNFLQILTQQGKVLEEKKIRKTIKLRLTSSETCENNVSTNELDFHRIFTHLIIIALHKT